MRFIRNFRPLGLRWVRLHQWLAVLLANDTPPSLRQLGTMLRLSLAAALSSPFRSPAHVSALRRAARRNYSLCCHCPLHDQTLHRCGSPDSALGCLCFMPYAIATHKTCWAREQSPPISDIGYP